MEVYFDTSDRDKEFVRIDAQKFLASGGVFALLKSKVKSPLEVAKVDFNRGPGSFTGLRVGAALVNALRYSLGLSAPRDVLLPKYGKEPNIGLVPRAAKE